MNTKDTTFVFKGYDAQIRGGEIRFFYELNRGLERTYFSETLRFPQPEGTLLPTEVLTPLLDSLLLILGISYWKLYCPKHIELPALRLSPEQAAFWNTVYTKGLGEFFYKNKLDYRGLVSFPQDTSVQPTASSFTRKDRSLVPLGGGKDSIVTAELLKSAHKPFTLFAVNPAPIQSVVAGYIEESFIGFSRDLDPKLAELNKQEGTYNGHVPISVVYAFVGLLAAAIYDYRSVVVSNERSANFGNVQYLGEEINHQWSKSAEFEWLLQSYVSRYIAPDMTYFSFLRPFSELKIAKLFAKHPKYFFVFSSCNRNFVLSGKPMEGKWCGVCAKCAFVFSLFAGILPKHEVISIFGTNLFADTTLVPLFRELFGLEHSKPFDCVGTPDELYVSFFAAYKKGEFHQDPIMELFEDAVLPRLQNVSALETILLTPEIPASFPPAFIDIISTV